MLHGIETNPIIVGAYSNSDGICPMLAAHRGGGRTSLISFADAWDRLAFRGERRPRARSASTRELLILRSHLEASLLADEAPGGDLAAARRQHEELAAARRQHEELAAARRKRDVARAGLKADQRGSTPSNTAPPRPGDPDRARALRHRPGWAWTRIVRRLDDYERLLADVDEAPREPVAPL
jgi:hypothetical protein